MADEKTDLPVIDDGDLGDTLPAIYVNRFFMRGGPIASRITFGELVDVKRPTGWRVAFLMGNDDLESLAHLILDLLGKTHPPQPSPEPSATVGAGTEALLNHGKSDK